MYHKVPIICTLMAKTIISSTTFCQQSYSASKINSQDTSDIKNITENSTVHSQLATITITRCNKCSHSKKSERQWANVKEQLLTDCSFSKSGVNNSLIGNYLHTRAKTPSQHAISLNQYWHLHFYCTI